MAGSKATPLCETCQHHETQSGRVDFMWGAGWIAAGVFAIFMSIFYMLISSNTDGIQQTRQVVARNERHVNEQIGDVKQTLTVISINQKRQMEQSGMRYISPDIMHYLHEEE